MAPNMLTALPYIRSERLRAFGVTSAKRSAGADDIPTIAEAGVPGYEAVQWYGVLAPAGTPRPIVDRLHAEVAKALQQRDVREKLSTDGAEAVGNTPEQFAAYIKAETEKWAKVVKAAGIKAE
jgi:tripartite-type tricarboxylate transporter receptor subunit TctC